MKLFVDLAALLTAPRHHAIICVEQLQLDGWSVVVFSGLDPEMTKVAIRNSGFHLYVDDVKHERDYSAIWVNRPEILNYAAFMGRATRLRRLTLPVLLSYKGKNELHDEED